MRKIVSLLVFTIITMIGNGQTDKVEKAILNTFDAMSGLNIDKLKQNCAADIVIVENGTIWNLDSLARRIVFRKSDSTYKRINTIQFIDTKVDGNTAWTYYSNQATGISSGKPFKIRWIESAVVVKENGEWKIKFLHSTLIERS